MIVENIDLVKKRNCNNLDLEAITRKIFTPQTICLLSAPGHPTDFQEMLKALFPAKLKHVLT